MPEVSSSEYELINVARAIVGFGKPSASMFTSTCPLKRSSPACVASLRETVAKGCVRRLASEGWRTAARVHHGQRVVGPLWQRHPIPKLEFTASSETLLRWVTQYSLVSDPSRLEAGPGTLADDLLFFLAMEASAEVGVAGVLAKQPAFRSSPLCLLAFPDVFARDRAKPRGLPDFSWLGDGLVIEALEPTLAERWEAMELGKGNVGDGAALAALGGWQTAVLTTFFETIDRAGRRDLCRFVLEAASGLAQAADRLAASGQPLGSLWLRSLSPRVKLSAQMEARSGGAAFLAALETPDQWVEAARSTHFIDDDHAAAQILLEIWETLGPAGLSVLRSAAKEMTALEAVSAN